MSRNRKDLTGKKYGKLTVLKYAGYGANKRQRISQWECLCDCGNVCVVPGYQLQTGRRKSCGCIRVASEKLQGLRFGKLTVLEKDQEGGTSIRKVICLCDCGNKKSVAFRDLKNGKVTSCGCDRVARQMQIDFFDRQYNPELEKKKEAFKKGDMCSVQTLEEWVYIWTREILPNVVKEITRNMYGETMERHVLPMLGKLRLSELTEEKVQDWVLALQKSQIPGTVRGQMTKGTVRNTLSVLSGCLRDAQKYGLIDKNPCTFSDWNYIGHNLWEAQEWLQKEQISRLESMVMKCQDDNGYPIGIAFQVILYAGLSMSEVLALKWKNVDFSQKMLSIEAFVAIRRRKENMHGEILYGLEEASGRRKRKVPVPDFLMEKLSEMWEEYGVSQEAFLVGNTEENPERMDKMRWILQKKAQEAGVEKVTPRLLRDTYAIHAVKAGATSDTIAELMGFASSQQVIRRYMPRSVFDKHELVNRMYGL